MEFASLRQRGTSLAIVTGAALVAVSILSPSVATAAGSRGSVLLRRSAKPSASVRVAEATVAEVTGSAATSSGTSSATAATDPAKKEKAAKGSIMIRKPTQAGSQSPRIQATPPLVIEGPNLVPQAAGSADVSGRSQSRQQRRGRRSRRSR